MKLLKTILILTLVLTPVYSYGKIDVTKLKNEGQETKPELPVHQNEITCVYEEGFLNVSFEREEGVAVLSLTRVIDGNEIASVSFTTACDFTYYIGDITEPVKVEIMSADGYYTTILY